MRKPVRLKHAKIVRVRRPEIIAQLKTEFDEAAKRVTHDIQ